MQTGQRFNPYRMFYGAMIPNWLLSQPDISSGAKLVYARLCQYAGENGVAVPAVQTLANEVGTNKRSVQRHLKDLETAGLIVRIARKKNGNIQTSNEYGFLWCDLMEPQEIAHDEFVTPPMPDLSPPHDEFVTQRESCKNSVLRESPHKRTEGDNPRPQVGRTTDDEAVQSVENAFISTRGYATLPYTPRQYGDGKLVSETRQVLRALIDLDGVDAVIEFVKEKYADHVATGDTPSTLPFILQHARQRLQQANGTPNPNGGNHANNHRLISPIDPTHELLGISTSRGFCPIWFDPVDNLPYKYSPNYPNGGKFRGAGFRDQVAEIGRADLIR